MSQRDRDRRPRRRQATDIITVQLLLRLGLVSATSLPWSNAEAVVAAPPAEMVDLADRQGSGSSSVMPAVEFAQHGELFLGAVSDDLRGGALTPATTPKKDDAEDTAVLQQANVVSNRSSAVPSRRLLINTGDCEAAPMCECTLGCQVFGGDSSGCYRRNKEKLASTLADMEGNPGRLCAVQMCIVHCAKKLKCLDDQLKGACEMQQVESEQCEIDCSAAVRRAEWRKASLAWAVVSLLILSGAQIVV